MSDLAEKAMACEHHWVSKFQPDIPRQIGWVEVCSMCGSINGAALSEALATHVVSAPEVQPAGQESREAKWAESVFLAECPGGVSNEDWLTAAYTEWQRERCGYIARACIDLAAEEQVELRVVVEGLRTQLATAGEESDAVCARLIQQRDALGSQVAAVKALEAPGVAESAARSAARANDAYASTWRQGYNACLGDVLAALESRLG